MGLGRILPSAFLRLALGVDPFDVQERVNLLEKLAQTDRLHQIVVMQPLGLAKMFRVDGVR